jgi:hypothetical protein
MNLKKFNTLHILGWIFFGECQIKAAIFCTESYPTHNLAVELSTDSVDFKKVHATKLPRELKNRMLKVTVALKVLDPKKASLPWNLIHFDASMPEHKHGMMVKPTVPQKISEGVWMIEGVKLHMDQTWEFVLDTFHGDKKERLVIRREL